MSEGPKATELTMMLPASELEGYGGADDMAGAAHHYLREVWGIACVVHHVDSRQDTADVGSYDDPGQTMRVGPQMVEIRAVRAYPIPAQGVSSGGGMSGGRPCRLCGRRTDYPHECVKLPTVLNSRYYCHDGGKHKFLHRRWGRRRCLRCGEKEARR